MLLIREVFTAKPGQAGKLARKLRDIATEFGWSDARVMTDLIGKMNTVVLETLTPDLLSFEQRMAGYAADERLHERMAGYTEMYSHGRREIFEVKE